MKKRNLVIYDINGYSKAPNGKYFGCLYEKTTRANLLQSKDEKINSIHKQLNRLDFIKNELDIPLDENSYNKLRNKYVEMLAELSYYDNSDLISYSEEGRKVHDSQQAFLKRMKGKIEKAIFKKLLPL